MMRRVTHITLVSLLVFMGTEVQAHTPTIQTAPVYTPAQMAAKSQSVKTVVKSSATGKSQTTVKSSSVVSVQPVIQTQPVGNGGDSRLRNIDYNPTDVIRLEGCINFQTMISLADNEHIENVGLGDSSQWQVMPNKRGNLLFVKPLTDKGYSNMTVVSDKRRYNFELKAASSSECARGQVVYDLRFRYAAEDKPVSAAVAPVDPNGFLPVPEKRNSAYTYSGDIDLVPVRVFDDGTSTYFKWSEGVVSPAVYAINSDNTESLINYHSRGDYFVIEQVARGFVLRRGQQKTTLYNDTYVVKGLDSLSPKPRGKP